MINKLKRKFIILATASMLALMAVLVGIMNLINYSVVVKESDATLAVLSKTPPTFFDKTDPPEKPPEKDDKFEVGSMVRVYFNTRNTDNDITDDEIERVAYGRN